MPFRRRPPGAEPTREELAALVSGWLPPERAREVEAWVAASLGLLAIDAEQRRSSAALENVRVSAPARLVVRITALRSLIGRRRADRGDAEETGTSPGGLGSS